MMLLPFSINVLFLLLLAVIATNDISAFTSPPITRLFSKNNNNICNIRNPTTTALADSSKSSSGSSDKKNQNRSDGSGNSGNQNDDEYDVIVLYPHSDVPFYLSETVTGEAAFAGYVQYQEPVSTIRNVGDVVISIDGEPCQGSSIQAIVKTFQAKAQTTAYSFVRFRSMTSSNHGSEGSGSGDSSSTLQPGQLPGERRRQLLEREIQQIEQQVETKLEEISDLQESLASKEAEIQELDKRDLEWIEQKRQALNKPGDSGETAEEIAARHDIFPGNPLANVTNTKNGSQYYAAEEDVPKDKDTTSSGGGWKL